MSEYLSPFASTEYFVLAGLLLLARAADLLSTWIGTPTLLLEANPLGRRLGWIGSILFNLVLCATIPMLPHLAIAITVLSFLVAFNNLDKVWLMRALGEVRYNAMVAAQITEASWTLYVACRVAQYIIITALGVVLMLVSGSNDLVLSIGFGIVLYAFSACFYSIFGMWRGRRLMRG